MFLIHIFKHIHGFIDVFSNNQMDMIQIKIGHKTNVGLQTLKR